jgi:hypothetical protein
MKGAWNRKHGAWRPYRDWSKTTVNIRFRGGPWADGQTQTDSLDPIKVVFDPPKRAVYAYVHQSDGVYLYSAAVSAELTEDYDASLKKWGDTSFHVVTA